MNLNTPLEYLPGIGSKKASVLIAEAGLRVVEDLITYYPYKYIDRRKFYTVSECVECFQGFMLWKRINCNM